MTTPLFLLRCTQLGVSIEDLTLLTIGDVYDMATEAGNDQYDYPLKATQKEFDVF